MKEVAAKRRSSRISSVENSKPDLKRKATTPLTTDDCSERPALRNLTNASKNVSNKTSENKDVVKKIPNYLRPTFSTQQKCTQKKVESKQPKPLSQKRSRVSTAPRVGTHQKVVKKPTVNGASGTCFGFEDEAENRDSTKTSDVKNTKSENQKSPEEIDLASPVRIELVPVRKIIPSTPKPPVNHVLSVLRSSLSSPVASTPRTVDTKLSQFFKKVTPQRSNESGNSTQLVDEPNLSFEQPPRRSYTRQRPVTNFSEFDEPSSDEEEVKDKENENENVTKKVEPKGKQKKQKKTKNDAQEKELEELAAAMNSQFNQVENFQLVVE